MKLRIYLAGISVSFICATNLFAHITCPEIPSDWNGNSNIEGWTFGYNRAEKDKELVFRNAWIYDQDQNLPAKCHYMVKGSEETTVQLYKNDITLGKYTFETNSKYSEKNHGLHCKGKTVQDCVIIPKFTTSYK